MAVLSPFFLSSRNFLNILLATSTIGVLAIGATFVIGSGGIDLSLGSVMGLSGVAGALSPSISAALADRRSSLCIVAGARCRLHQRPAGHPRLRARLHRHARHARPGARPGAGHLQGRVDLRPAAGDRLYRPGPAVRHSDAGHHLRAHRPRRALRARLHALRPPHAGARRQRGRRARRRHPRRAITGASSTRCRARSPALPACCSPRASMPATRPPGSTTNSPPSPRRSSAAPICSAAAARSSAP